MRKTISTACPRLARELVRLDVDLLFVSGDQGVKAAKQATDTISILVAACDPLESLVVSIARPAGKATGVTCISSELAGSSRPPLLTRHAARDARPVATGHFVSLFTSFLIFGIKKRKGPGRRRSLGAISVPDLFFLTAPRPHLFAERP